MVHMALVREQLRFLQYLLVSGKLWFLVYIYFFNLHCVFIPEVVPIDKKNGLLLHRIKAIYYMACVSGRYNARGDWLRAAKCYGIILHNVQGTIMDHANFRFFVFKTILLAI